MYCVYKHTGPEGKVYIGVTKIKPEKRWSHGKGYSSNRYFSRAIEKYGWDNFRHEIIESGLTRQEASDREKYYIALYDSTNPKYGYNIEGGGLTEKVFTDSLRKEFSERGKRVCAERPELEKKMHDSCNEYFSNPANRKKHSDTLKDYYNRHPEAKERLSRQNLERCTPEYRKKLSDVQKKAKRTPEARIHARNTHAWQMKPIDQYDIEWNFIQHYEGIGDAVRATGICRQNIMKVLNHALTAAGTERQTAGGYRWKYTDEVA